MDNRLSLAVKYYQSNLVDQAAQLVAELLAEDSPPPEAFSLGATLAFERGHYLDAIEHCDHLIDVGMGDGHTLLLKGRALSDLGRQQEAVSCLEQAILAEPEFAAAHYNLGWILGRIGDGQGAVAAYRQAIALQDLYPVAWNNLGLELDRLGDGDGATEAFRTAIGQFPEFSMAHNNLGATLATSGQYHAAERAYAKAIEVDPGNTDAHSNIGVARLEQGNVPGAIAAFAAVLERNPQHAATVDNFLYSEIYQSDDPVALRNSHDSAASHLKIHAAQTGLVAVDPDKPLRVGFLSPDFRRHSVSFFALPLIQGLKNTLLTPVLFSDVVSTDSITDAYKVAAEEWHDVVGQPDEVVMQVMRDARLDVVIELAGRTTGNRLGVLANRVAPVQIMALGYPGPTGVPAVDYWLCDEVTNSKVLGESVDRDRPLRLERRLHVFAPPADAPTVAPLPAIKTNTLTFGSFNKLAKISDDSVVSWARVLQEIPDSQLLIKARALAEPETASILRARFEALGIEGRRIETRGWAAEDRAHLATYAEVDIALDTFPYNGTTTTCEALWMGVPVLTMSGKGHAARVGASLLSSCDLLDWVTETPDEFVAAAVFHAQDHATLTTLRASLRESLAASALTDTKAAAIDLEKTLRRAWVEKCRLSA